MYPPSISNFFAEPLKTNNFKQDMKAKLIVAAHALVLFLFTVETQRLLRDLIDRLLGREKAKITEIKDIFENRERYNGTTVTVEGTFGRGTIPA